MRSSLSDAVEYCDAASLLTGVSARCAILDVSLASEVQLREALKTASRGTLIVRSSAAELARRAWLVSEAVAVNARISLQRVDCVDVCCRMILEGRHPNSARNILLDRAALLWSPELRTLVLIGVSLSERAISVQKWAQVCGWSVRTLEHKLAVYGVPQAKRLLMWLFTLHTVWRVTTLGWSLKRAAAEGGLTSARALSARIERATGVRLPELCRDLGFINTFEAFRAQMLSRALAHSRVRQKS